MRKEFIDFAEKLEEVYGAYFDREEGFVECPKCGDEPIYDYDWSPNEYSCLMPDGSIRYFCPICEEIFDFN